MEGPRRGEGGEGGGQSCHGLPSALRVKATNVVTAAWVLARVHCMNPDDCRVAPFHKHFEITSEVRGLAKQRNSATAQQRKAHDASPPVKKCLSA